MSVITDITKKMSVVTDLLLFEDMGHDVLPELKSRDSRLPYSKRAQFSSQLTDELKTTT